MRIGQLFLLFILLLQALLATGCGQNENLRPEYIDAQELKLKIRELADQMLATRDNTALTGLVAMPSSFVNLDNKMQTSPFGNLMGESLIYEFNQRAFPVREYRLTGDIRISHTKRGDFALLRDGFVPANETWSAIIVGTYYQDEEAVFVNARLVRASDGLVLRTGQLVLAITPVIERMLEPLGPTEEQIEAQRRAEAEARWNAQKPGLGLPSGTLQIKQASPATYSPGKNPGPGLYGN